MRFFLGLGLALVLLTIGILVFGTVHYMRYDPPISRYPVRGIDISHHQGLIDWDVLRTQGVDFVFMKATEGGDFKDRRFKANWQAAARAGIVRGAYHFFTFCRPGLDQAQNFIDSVPVAANSLPPVVDLEFGGNCAKKPTIADIKKELGGVLERLESHYRKKPILYVTQEFYETYHGKLGFNHPLWVRSIRFEPRYAQKTWLFWQYHNNGRRAGISGPVDLNVFRGDRERFQSLLVLPGR